MQRYYVCAVLSPEDAVLGPPDLLTGRPTIITPAKPQRPKVYDLDGYDGWAADIPTDPATGLTLKPWCIVAVEAPPAVHAVIAQDIDVWTLSENTVSRSDARNFLRDKGEVNPPDEPQAVLERLHPLDGKGGVPQIVNLRTRPR